MTTTLAPRTGREAAPAPTEQTDAQPADEQPVRWWRLTWQVLSGVAVIVIVAVAAAALVVPRALGGAGLIVETGSMRPTIEPGDLVAVADVDPSELTTGDIVTYATETDLVTHRVVGFTANDGEQRIILQGDANNTPDEPIEPEQVRGKVAYTIPKLGFVKEWVAGNLLLLGGGLVLLWAAYAVVEGVSRRRRAGARQRTTDAAATAAGPTDVEALSKAARDAAAAASAAEVQAEVARAAAAAAMAAVGAASRPTDPAAGAAPSPEEQQ